MLSESNFFFALFCLTLVTLSVINTRTAGQSIQVLKAVVLRRKKKKEEQKRHISD